jgi:hypothetical protein
MHVLHRLRLEATVDAKVISLCSRKGGGGGRFQDLIIELEINLQLEDG